MSVRQQIPRDSFVECTVVRREKGDEHTGLVVLISAYDTVCFAWRREVVSIFPFLTSMRIKICDSVVIDSEVKPFTALQRRHFRNGSDIADDNQVSSLTVEPLRGGIGR